MRQWSRINSRLKMHILCYENISNNGYLHIISVKQSSFTELLECKQTTIQYYCLDMYHIGYQIKLQLLKGNLRYYVIDYS